MGVIMTCNAVANTPVINSLRPRQNRLHFADDVFKCNFLNENVWIPIKISLKFVPKGPINDIPALVQVMAWRRPGDKPLSEPVMDSLPTHICVTRPQWVKSMMTQFFYAYMDGLVQERRNSIANVLGFCLSCTNPLIWSTTQSSHETYRLGVNGNTH